tara:strand:+ start:18566 stop:18691 length:126 start_codon:yes stop_codon:yes gene_type:complete
MTYVENAGDILLNTSKDNGSSSSTGQLEDDVINELLSKEHR